MRRENQRREGSIWVWNISDFGGVVSWSIVAIQFPFITLSSGLSKKEEGVLPLAFARSAIPTTPNWLLRNQDTFNMNRRASLARPDKPVQFFKL